MKRTTIVLFLAFAVIFPAPVHSQNARIDFSITLSGAILYGIDYHYTFDKHSAIRAGIYLGVEKWHFVPGIHANYQYSFLPGKTISPYVGIGPDFMLTTDPKRGWVHLTLLKFPTGMTYNRSEKNQFGLEIWPAYFAARKKMVPLIGISGIYSRKW